ncbi:MAG: hypothetical protein LLF96_00920 [Eubacteriales bacterium]|nr:hypothetical protein [Eubacteriales bacterium]
MDFANIAWWAYLLTTLAGLGFGFFQSLLMKRAVLGEKPQRWLFALKAALWIAALVLMALVSIPLLLVFVVVASLMLLIVSLRMFLKTQKGAR